MQCYNEQHQCQHRTDSINASQRLDDMASSNGCQTAMSCLAPSQVASRTLTCKSRHDIAVLECDSVRCRSRHSRNHRLGFESGHHSPAAMERRKVGGGRAWFLHQFAFPAMLLILACLATSSQGTPLPPSRVSALRTAETDWRRYVYDEPIVDDSNNLAGIPSAVQSGDMLEIRADIAPRVLRDDDAEEGEHKLAKLFPNAKNEEEEEEERDSHAGNKGELDWAWNHETLRRYRRSSGSGVGALWENATIPFAFHKNLSKYNNPTDYQQIRYAIRRAMRMWEDKTCIRFVPYMRGLYKNWISFMPPDQDFPEKRCSSYIGRARGIQPVFLGKECQFAPGIIMHELGHVIGFYHEQQRPNRDQYIRVNKENILDGESNQRAFRIHPNLNSYNESYDIDSIMHYGSYYLSKDERNLKTIEVIGNPEYELGQRQRLTLIDIARTNKMYGCPFPETCMSRKHSIRSGHLLSIMIRISSAHRVKWFSCRRQDGLCRRLTCGQLSEGDCTNSPNHCGNELFTIVRGPGRLVNHKVYANSPVMLRSHVQPLSATSGRRRRRSNSTREGFLTCNTKDGFSGPGCRVVPCNSHNPYETCRNAVFFFLPVHTPRVVREESNLSVDDPLEAEITENTPVGLCQKDEHGNVRCIGCQPKSVDPMVRCIPMECGKMNDAVRTCRQHFVQLRQWAIVTQSTEMATKSNIR